MISSLRMIGMLILSALLAVFLTACGGGGGDNDGSDGGGTEVPTRISKIEVAIADNVYNYENTGGAGIQSSEGFGPRIDTAGDDTWPVDNPRLDLWVILGGFPFDEGIPNGTTIDLSTATSEFLVTVSFSVSTPPSGIVGDEPVYAYYETTVGKGEDRWVLGSAGTVHINEFAPNLTPNDWVDYRMDIILQDVILQKTVSNEPLDREIWPAEVSILSSRFCNLDEGCGK